LGNLKKGLLFIVSAPSGAGKTTLIERLCQEVPLCARSITCTTRPKRPHETEGKDYNFLSPQEFEKKRGEGAFLESAEVFGHSYGTLKSDVDRLRQEGKHLFLVIDTQGALFLKDRVDAVYIFIQPPSMEELKQRLLKRKSEAEADIELRLSFARAEIEKSRYYDYQVINDDLEIASAVLKSIVIAEEHKTWHATAF
jgi:guanylate kinase